MVKNKSPQSQIVKHGCLAIQSFTTRNLQPQDLGAVIFGCTNNTFSECHSRQLFGLPRAHTSYVKNIKEGLPLFLFNYDDRRLHGIYEAASNGKFCPQSNAWSHNGKEKTGYPAQVEMRLRVWCFPLAESQFRTAILTNYYQKMPGVPGQMRHFFQFELDHAQTHALITMFTPLPPPYNVWTPPVAAPGNKHVRKSTLAPECEVNCDVKSEKVVIYADTAKEKIKEIGTGGVNAESSNGFDDGYYGDTLLKGCEYALSNKESIVQQLQSDQQDNKLRVKLELQKLKVLSPQQHSSEFCANATPTAGIDTYSCKDAQEVRYAEDLNAEVDQLSLGHSNLPLQSLDFESCTKAKMMNTRNTTVNKLSPSPLAMTQQFQETETLRKKAAYETPNNNENNSAPEATDHAAHSESHCAEFMSIRPLTLACSQEPMRDVNSLHRERKRKTTTRAIQRSPSGHHEIQNTCLTELPSPNYVSYYVKDRLIGRITCMVCGEEGHYTCHCPMKDRENKVICNLCKKAGHCYLWCCRQNVSEYRACRRCGEKGHYTNKDLSHCDEKYTNMYVRCSSCDKSHPLGRCPMGKVTCFLCEGKDHVPTQCFLSPMLTATQYYREGFQAILKQALTETSRRVVTSVKPSRGLEPHDDSHECQVKRNCEMVRMISSFSHSGQSHCERKIAIRSVPDSDTTEHAAMTDEALAPGSSSACFNCHEEGHYANRCPKKKLPGEIELRDVTCFKFRAKRCGKKQQPAGFELCDVTCFYCHDKGHYSYNCPKNKPPGGLELPDVTCINFDANGCDREKPPGELLCDVTCFKCHDKGHYSYSCRKNKAPGKYRGEGHKAKKCPKKKRKKEQQK